MSNEFVERLRPLRPGQAITLRFPGRLVSRDTYLRVNSAAASLFGAGRYRLRKERGSPVIWVARMAA